MRTITAALALLAVALLIRLAQSPDIAATLGDFGTSIAQPLVLPIVNLINQPAFVYIASTVIFVSALIVVIAYLVTVTRPQLAGTLRATAEIGVLPRDPGADWRMACGEIDAILRRNNVLLSPWATYLQEANALRRLPTRRFSLYAEADAQSGLNPRPGIMAALPSYYTTVGLILTFVGLVVALYFASRGFRSGDMVEARTSIVQLLNASAFKFLTSVAALVSALMISVVHRLTGIHLRNRGRRLLTAIDLYLQHHRADETDTDAATAVAIGAKLDEMIAELRATRQAIGRVVEQLARKDA